MSSSGVIVLTGATSGIGKAVALKCAQRNVHLILPVRNLEKGAQVLQEIEVLGSTAELLYCDLSSLESVKNCTQNILKMAQPIHMLVNNAGVFNSSRMMTPEGFEQTMAVNHLAPFLFTLELLDVLDQPNGRIVNVSSEAHRYGALNLSDPSFERRYVPISVYGASKLANILFTSQLAQRLQHASTYAVHPGVVATNIGGAAKGVIGVASRLARYFMRSPEQGAEPLIKLMFDDILESLSGAYFNRFRHKIPSKAAQDKEMAEELWGWSLKQVSQFRSKEDDQEKGHI